MYWPYRLGALGLALLQGLLYLLIQLPGTGLPFPEAPLLTVAAAVGMVLALAVALWPPFWHDLAKQVLAFFGIMFAMVNGAHFLWAVLLAGVGYPGQGWWQPLVWGVLWAAFVGCSVWVLFAGIFRPAPADRAEWEPFG